MRGQPTTNTPSICKQYGVSNLTVKEIKLIPYLLYACVNFGVLNRNKINREEAEILLNWQDQNYIAWTANNIFISEHFYNFCNAIVFDSYVENKIP